MVHRRRLAEGQTITDSSTDFGDRIMKPRQTTTIENAGYRTSVGLGQSLFQSFVTSQWVRDRSHAAASLVAGGRSAFSRARAHSRRQRKTASA